VIRDTNPYVTQVDVNGYGIEAFYNTRVRITTDDNGIVNAEPKVG
jgi:hypothetical protein